MQCNLEVLIENMGHICELAGNNLHIDGGFDKEQTSFDEDTIVDLQNMPLLLFKLGYTTAHVENVMHGNC